MTKPNGFTLLETLAALAVFGLLLAGLAQGTRYGLRVWQAQVAIDARSGDLDAVDRALRRMIEAMDPGDGDATSMSATADRLAFVTTLPDAAGTDPPQRIAATLLVDAAHRLVLRWRPYLHAVRLRPPPPETHTELLRGVTRLDVAFWQPGRGWLAGWRNADPPALVRIRVVFAASDARHWPDIVVAPALAPP